MKAFITASLLASAATVFAQYSINPNSVSNSTREGWCTQQQSQCPLICLQTAANSDETESNTCDPTTLTFSCVCSNGISPNVSEYSQTLPYYICQEWGNQCVSNCGGDSSCQNDCRANHPCGAQNPTRVNTSTITSTVMSTTTTSANGGEQTTDSDGATIYSGFAGAGATSGSGSSGSGGNTSAAVRVWALSVGQTFGSLALIAAFVGGFAVLL